jgi:hypothetical protein
MQVRGAHLLVSGRHRPCRRCVARAPSNASSVERDHFFARSARACPILTTPQGAGAQAHLLGDGAGGGVSVRLPARHARGAAVRLVRNLNNFCATACGPKKCFLNILDPLESFPAWSLL